jgi:hypothetical protein
MEIEGETEKQVIETMDLLQVDKNKVTALNCQDIYDKIYGIDISKLKELKF